MDATAPGGQQGDHIICGSSIPAADGAGYGWLCDLGGAYDFPAADSSIFNVNSIIYLEARCADSATGSLVRFCEKTKKLAKKGHIVVYMLLGTCDTRLFLLITFTVYTEGFTPF